MTKECSSCDYFRGYYSKTYCGFYREKFGRCWKHDKVCDKHESCDRFKTRTKKYPIKKGVIINALCDAVTDINTIKNILEERELQ